jgi:hypothetical protein
MLETSQTTVTSRAYTEPFILFILLILFRLWLRWNPNDPAQ